MTPHETDNRQAEARLVEYVSGRYIALPLHVTLEVVNAPKIMPVPDITRYAYGLMNWQGRWIPVLDLFRLFHSLEETPLTTVPRYALVVHCKTTPQSPAHGAIGLPKLPQTIRVDNSLACVLPKDSPLWPRLSLSCFALNKRPVPIIDTGRLFGGFHSGQ